MKNILNETLYFKVLKTDSDFEDKKSMEGRIFEVNSIGFYLKEKNTTWYFDVDEVEPSTKQAYEAQFKPITISKKQAEERLKEVGINVKIK